MEAASEICRCLRRAGRCHDAQALGERLGIEISSQDLNHIFELETSLIPLMVDMRARGVRVDLDKADIVRGELRAKVKEIKKEIKRKTGVEIEPWAGASVLQVFEALNLEYPTTEAGAPSFTKQYLNNHPHEVCQMIVKLREFDKADSTFIDSILRHEKDGRIHTEFHQLRSDDGGTVTGRFSSSNPNLQQIPARDPDIKKMIRGLFILKRDRSGGRLTTRAKSQGCWYTLCSKHARQYASPGSRYNR